MIVLDIETSGLNPDTHGLLSIGAIDLRAPSKAFYGESRLRLQESFEPEALKINGFTTDEIRSTQKQSTAQLLRQFSDWLESRPVKVIGGMHVASFDVPFLNAKAKQCRISLRLHRRSIDLHSIAYAKMLSLKRVVPLTDGWSVMDTDTIHPFCGLPKEPLPRSALHGAKWEAESLCRLIYGKPLLKEFVRYPVPAYLR